MHDIDIRYENVITEFLNETKIFQHLSGQIALVRNFTEIFQDGNGSLESMLIEAGLHKNIIDLIFDGYINVNRVI